MSCEKCEQIQEKGMAAYVRVGSANVGLIGCPQHINQLLNRSPNQLVLYVQSNQAVVVATYDDSKDETVFLTPDESEAKDV